MIGQSNPYYCPHIYKNIYIEKTPGDTVKTSACCVNDSSDAYSVINFYENPYLNQQRQQVRNAERISTCNSCWQQEDLGNFSLRNSANNVFRFQDPYKHELLGIDYNVSPICNAKCIMCSSYYSSAWAAEDAKFGLLAERSFKQVSSTLGPLELDYRKLQKIYFNGGEPLLSTDMVDMLRIIREQQGSLNKVDIRFNTNGSVFPSNEVLALLGEARSLIIFFSIDAINEQFEYIRNPLRWNEVQRNIAELSKKSLLPHFRHVSGITCTVGVHNVLEVQSLYDWYKDFKQNLPCLDDFNVQPVCGNLSFNEGISEETKQAMLSALTYNEVNSRIRPWILAAPTDRGDHPWINYLNTIDKRRGLNWRETLKVSTVAKN